MAFDDKLMYDLTYPRISVGAAAAVTNLEQGVGKRGEGDGRDEESSSCATPGLGARR